MRTIKYHIKIIGVNEKQQTVELETYASSSSELFKNLKEILDKNSKTWIEKILSFTR